MQGISAPDILWHTNVLLANLCDRKKVCDNGTLFSPSPQMISKRTICF